MMKRIVETDSFGRDYPNEKWLQIPPLCEHQAKVLADIINGAAGEDSDRYWKVVDLDYELSPAFEP
jgi:hypothetical protein